MKVILFRDALCQIINLEYKQIHWQKVDRHIDRYRNKQIDNQHKWMNKIQTDTYTALSEGI